MSRVSDSIDDVVTLINAASLSQTVTAARKNTVDYETDDAPTLTVNVLPRFRTAEFRSRNDVVEIHTVDIVVRKKVANDTTAVDDLVTFVDELADLLAGAALSTAGAIVTGYSQEDYFDLAALHENRIFLSILTLTIRD